MILFQFFVDGTPGGLCNMTSPCNPYGSIGCDLKSGLCNQCGNGLRPINGICLEGCV